MGTRDTAISPTAWQDILASISWKLVVTPLQASQGEARAAVVSAENWLSALRLARKQLGEEGGVPPGASCVMGPTGEVTIVDIASRRRFTLSRSSEAAMPAPSAAPVLAVAASAPEAKPRATTMAYSPEESAAIRAQLVAATQPAKPSAPAAVPRAPSSPKLVPVAQAPLPSRVAAPAAPIAPSPATPAHAAAQPRPLSATPLTSQPAVPPPAKRSTTVAYSPEESAAVRAQLGAAQQASSPAPTPPAAPAAGKSATVAYMQSPFAAGSTSLIVVSKRDEEPSASSPLLYRERGYFSPNASNATLAEQALRGELATLRSEVDPTRRGVFISLALFDHYFEGKPQRGPIATLQWKDWRGEPVFAWSTAVSAPAFSANEPVRTSFVPQGQAAQPAAPSVVVVGRAPSAALATPARGPNDSWPGVAGTREPTGEQDRRLAVAFEAVQDLYFLASVAEGMDFGVKLLAELVPSEAVTGCIYDINTDELRFVALTGPGAEERRADAIPSRAGLLGNAAHSGRESIIIPDVNAESRFDPAADGRVGLESRNMLLLPLQKADNMLGVLQLINREKRGFSESDASVSAYVAGQLAEFLQTKRLSLPRR